MSKNFWNGFKVGMLKWVERILPFALAVFVFVEVLHSFAIGRLSGWGMYFIFLSVWTFFCEHIWKWGIDLRVLAISNQWKRICGETETQFESYWEIKDGM